jgi:hypothetical protein
VSNVRGPDMALHIMGKEVKQIVGFLPPPPGCPIGIAVTSYRGQLQLSVNASKQTLASLKVNTSQEDERSSAVDKSTSRITGGGSGGRWRSCDAEEFLARVSKRLEIIIEAADEDEGTFEK